MKKTYTHKSSAVEVSREARLWIGTIIGTILFLSNENVENFIADKYYKTKNFFTNRINHIKSRKNNK